MLELDDPSESEEKIVTQRENRVVDALPSKSLRPRGLERLLGNWVTGLKRCVKTFSMGFSIHFKNSPYSISSVQSDKVCLIFLSIDPNIDRRKDKSMRVEDARRSGINFW